MQRGAVQHALEAGGRLRLDAAAVDHQAAQLVVEELLEVAAQHVDVDAARAQHRQAVLVLGQREQQVLERGVLVLALVGAGQRPVQALFEIG